VQVSILYLAVVSNYALVLTLAGAEQAAETKVAQIKDADVQDVVDILEKPDST
jgi:hypothetical protein